MPGKVKQNGQHVVLVGGGHAHVAVLADWIRHGLPCARATLLTPHRHLRYSGTVPGWIAGQYPRDFGLVDLAGLCARAGVDLVEDMCAAIDPAGSAVTTGVGRRIDFDVASIDTGGVGRARAVLGDDDRLIDIRPIDGFVDRFAALAPDLAKDARIAVIGGGAGGVELAFALRNARIAAAPGEVVFVTGNQGLLPDHSRAVRAAAARQLAHHGIAVIAEGARIADGMLMAGNRSLEPVGLIVAAMGSGAPAWPRAGGLVCDAAGFIAVDAHQRSISHSRIFAVGDVAARQDRALPHSGVHAVFAGPVLAANLRSALAGREPVRSYTPRWNNLYLLSTGDGAAIASYGRLAMQGRWVARLKHWIDNRWLAQYAGLVHRQ